MVLPYLKGFDINKEAFLSISIYLYFVLEIWVANLHIRSVRFGARSAESNYRSVFFGKKHPISKKKSG